MGSFGGEGMALSVVFYTVSPTIITFSGMMVFLFQLFTFLCINNFCPQRHSPPIYVFSTFSDSGIRLLCLCFLQLSSQLNRNFFQIVLIWYKHCSLCFIFFVSCQFDFILKFLNFEMLETLSFTGMVHSLVIAV